MNFSVEEEKFDVAMYHKLQTAAGTMADAGRPPDMDYLKCGN